MQKTHEPRNLTVGVEIFQKNKGFCRCKSEIFVIGDKNTGCGDKVAEARGRSARHGDGFYWLGGHPANQEAPEFSSRGSWLLFTPFLV